MQAKYELDNQLQEEELRKLKELNTILEERAMTRYYEIQKLQADLAKKELLQLVESNNEYMARLAKHQKTGFSYCNRSFECLSARLKMPQFTCLTLQPFLKHVQS